MLWINIITPDHKTNLINLDQIVSISRDIIKKELLLFDNTGRPFIIKDPTGNIFNQIFSILHPTIQTILA